VKIPNFLKLFINIFIFMVKLRRGCEVEVRFLRQLISEKRITITTVTKGVPFTKLEVRPLDQIPSYSGPVDDGKFLKRTHFVAIF